MNKKRLSLIFLFVGILNIIIAFNLFFEEQTILNINYTNREDFKKAMNTDKINNIDVDSIRKVKLGNGWHSGELTIYYNGGILDGRFGSGMAYYNLEQYVRNNGYSVSSKSIIPIYISLFCFIVFAILRNSSRNSYW